MGHEHFWWGGWWIFPIFMPIVMFFVLLIVLYTIFGRGGWRPPWWEERDRDSPPMRDMETALDILKRRYAQGEIAKEEFEQIKKDIES